MDTTQLLLIVVLSVTTILLIIVGIQLIFILREVRKLLVKSNNIVESFEKVGIAAEHGMGEITGFASGFRTLFKVIEFVHNKKHEK